MTHVHVVQAKSINSAVEKIKVKKIKVALSQNDCLILGNFFVKFFKIVQDFFVGKEGIWHNREVLLYLHRLAVDKD